MKTRPTPRIEGLSRAKKTKRISDMNANLLKFRGLLIGAFHALVIVVSLSVAFWIRFEFTVRSLESPLLMTALMLVVPFKMIVFLLGSMQRGWWRYAGLTDLVRIFLTNAAASGVSAI